MPAWSKDRVTDVCTLSSGDFKLVVHRHIDHPGKWCMTVFFYGSQVKELEATRLPEARKEALEAFKSLLFRASPLE
jgi:hypothetical protein